MVQKQESGAIYVVGTPEGVCLPRRGVGVQPSRFKEARYRNAIYGKPNSITQQRTRELSEHRIRRVRK